MFTSEFGFIFGFAAVNATPNGIVGFGFHMQPSKKADQEFSEQEATARFEAALKSALNTPHTPHKSLKERSNVKKAKKSGGTNEK
jgi:hypothetical protein